MRTTFSTPTTPTRDSPNAIAGARDCTSSPAPLVGDSVGVTRLACTPASLARARALAALARSRIPDRRFWYHSALSLCEPGPRKRTASRLGGLQERGGTH